MNGNPFTEARDKLPSAVSTLPPGYLDRNASALLAVVEELKNSYKIELRAIQAIKDLDLTKPEAVDELTQSFSRYHEDRDFDRERTHCHNIDRIVRTMLVPLHGGTQSDRKRVAEVETALQHLSDADNDILDDVEPMMDRVLQALTAINEDLQSSKADSTRLDDAHSKLQAFISEFEPKREKLKAVLKRMNTLANDLIDRL